MKGIQLQRFLNHMISFIFHSFIHLNYITDCLTCARHHGNITVKKTETTSTLMEHKIYFMQWYWWSWYRQPPRFLLNMGFFYFPINQGMIYDMSSWRLNWWLWPTTTGWEEVRKYIEKERKGKGKAEIKEGD